MHAALVGITAIVGARVAVVAGESGRWLATVLRVARLRAVAGIAVIAIERDARLAPDLGIACFHSVADVFVVAHEARSSNTGPFCALVVGSAHVVVAAGGRVVDVQAALVRLTRVVSARIVVRTDQRDTGSTATLVALVSDRAGIPIFTRESFVVRHKGALPAIGITRCFQADSIGTVPRFGAGNDRFRVHDATMGQLLSVTVERAVAYIPVFQGYAILVRQAVTGNLEPLALAVTAFVCHCAGVLVIAILCIVLEHTPSHSVARIVGARIVVVANHRVSKAHSLFAVVSDSTGITVDTLSLGEHFVLAAGFSQTVVIRAIVAVVAQVHVVALDLLRLVNVAVAIVIKPVACLLSRNGGIAV